MKKLLHNKILIIALLINCVIYSQEIQIRGLSNTIISDNDVNPSLTDGTDFGNININYQTKSQIFIIENLGSSNLVISTLIISGSNASEFTITSSPSTLSIAPGNNVTFEITFNPNATGTRNATIDIFNNDSNESPYNYNIRGTGTDPEINVKGNTVLIVNGDSSPTTLDWTDFGSIPYGTGNLSRVFTIENTGATQLSISNPTISGMNPSDYSITTNPSSTNIGSGISRSFTVRFNPTSAGLKTAIITLVNNDFDQNPYTFTVQGFASNVEIDITGDGNTIINGDTTPSLTDNTDYDTVLLESGALSKTFVIHNTGLTDLMISNPVISGMNASDFTITTSPALIIPGGASTTMVIEFEPNALGRRNATITIANNDIDENPYVFAIHGYGDIDTDGDGIPNNKDIDDDNDGITDDIECSTCLSNPFVNGSFETPVIPTATYAILPTTNVPGWQTSAENFIEIWNSGFNGVPAATGNQFAELNANIPGILYQTFCLNGSGGTINWSIKHRGRGGVDQAFVKFGSTLAGSIASTPIVTMVDGNTAWGTYSGVYTIPNGQTQIVLTFQAGYTGSGSASVGNFIDDVQIVINQNCVDSDGDGIPDIVDLDDDNDGIPDIEEAGFKIYSNKKSTMDMSSISTWVDADENGMNDYIDALIANGIYNIPNTDGDSKPDHLDLDSDNDSLFDVDEAGLFNGDGDINGDGVGDLLDSDGDGILDLYDNFIGFGTNNRDYTKDSDGDGIEDFRALDSNNDGIFDIAETLYANLDANNDGLIDGTDDNDKDGIMDLFDTDDTKKGSPRDLSRKLYLDFDGRNDYAEDSQILSGLSQATLMAWIDLNNTFSSTGVVIGQEKFNIKVLDNKKLRATVNGKILEFDTALETSRWYHVGAVLGNDELKLFLNGTVVATRSLTETIQTDTSKLTLGKNPSSYNDYFKGKIDEVRVFNTALSDLQFQRMVYQEIENNSSEVKGLIVPKNIGSLPFTNLLRYYRMDTFKDDIIDDLTTPTVDVGTGMKMYNHKVINYQQAPMPFITERTGDFAAAVHNTSKDIRGLDLLEQDWSIVLVKHNITETANNTDLAMFVDPGVTIIMDNDTKIQNDWYLKLDGKIDLIGKSQLVQTAYSDLDVTSSGFIERDQQGQTIKFNYNYWSSPVSSINSTSINHGHTVAGVMKDGTNPDDIKNILWTSGLDSSISNPIRLSSSWIYKYQNSASNYYNWIPVGQNGTLLTGQGYTLKGSSAATETQNYTFVGKPNNGTITATVGANNLLLTGNPYPSAIDADEFIRDNLDSTSGVIQFWEHFRSNNSHVTAEYQGGYATRTLVGGTTPVSPEIISGLGASSRVPGRFIPVGQGFFIAGSETGGTLKFENDQRIFMRENNVNSNIMFRNNNPTTANNVQPTNLEDSIVDEEQFMKLKLGHFAGNNRYHRQILIGFMNEHADSAINPGYDAISSEDFSNDMYFLSNDKKLNILGDGFFNESLIYPLGVKNATVGNVEFAIDSKENFTENQNIYIYDSVTNNYHDLNQETFTINLPVGTFLDRFSLRFSNTNALSVNENNLESGIIILNNNDNNTILIKNQLLETTAKTVSLFNMLGQQIASWNIQNTDQTNIELPVSNVSTGTYIIKVMTNNGNLNKKILIK
jgi:hypothetical protein